MYHTPRGHRFAASVGREFDGTIVRRETFVFLDVVWLTRILKPLLNHKDFERHDGSVFLGELDDTGIVLTKEEDIDSWNRLKGCLLYTSPSPRDLSTSRMPSSA